MQTTEGNNKPFNLVVSSWPSAGGTTISLVIATLLGLKYIYAGGVLKEWARRMGYDPTSNEFHEWEDKYGESWDHFWENYISKKLSSTEGFLSEGKTLGFLLPAGRANEIFIIADAETRAHRAHIDGRTEEIKARDSLLANRWKRLFGIELLNRDSLKENYDFVLDNSKLTISQSLLTVWEHIVEWHQLPNDFLQDPKSYFDQVDAQFQQEKTSGIDPRKRWKDQLASKNLYISSESVFSEWIEDYQNELAKLPQEMRQAVTNDN